MADLVELLAGGHRNATLPGDLVGQFFPFGSGRLLPPEKIERRQSLGDANRLARSEAAVHVDQDLQFRPKALRMPAGCRRRYRIAFADEPRERAEGIELQRLKSLGDDILGGRRNVPASARCDTSRWHSQDRVAVLSPQQLPDRDTQRLAENIPAGDFDRCHHQPVDVSRVRDRRDDGGNRVHLPRIFAHAEVRQLMNSRLGRADKPVDRRFADAVQPASVRLYEEPVFPARADGIGLDMRDFHGSGQINGTLEARQMEPNAKSRQRNGSDPVLRVFLCGFGASPGSADFQNFDGGCCRPPRFDGQACRRSANSARAGCAKCNRQDANILVGETVMETGITTTDLKK